jgi:hypothetical protein
MEFKFKKGKKSWKMRQKQLNRKNVQYVLTRLPLAMGKNPPDISKV